MLDVVAVATVLPLQNKGFGVLQEEDREGTSSDVSIYLKVMAVS